MNKKVTENLILKNNFTDLYERTTIHNGKRNSTPYGSLINIPLLISIL